MCQRVKVQCHRGIGKGLWEEVSLCVRDRECCWVEAGGGWTSRKACLPWQHKMWGDCQWSSIWTRETQGKHWEGWRKCWVLVSECWFDATLCVNDQLPLKSFDNHIFTSKINFISVSVYPVKCISTMIHLTRVSTPKENTFGRPLSPRGRQMYYKREGTCHMARTRTHTRTQNYLKRHIALTSTASNKYYNLTLTENFLYFY